MNSPQFSMAGNILFVVMLIASLPLFAAAAQKSSLPGVRLCQGLHPARGANSPKDKIRYVSPFAC